MVATTSLSSSPLNTADHRPLVDIPPSLVSALGLQLYSLREQLSTDLPGTLKRVHDLGFCDVELAGTHGRSPETFHALLVANQLTPVAGHFACERFRDDPEGVANEAKALGLRYAGLAWIAHAAPFTVAIARDTAKLLNRAGEVLARQGLKCYFHTHGYEFVPHGDGTLFDLLVAETAPELVSFQMDVMWTVLAAQDPVKLLARHGNRWALMHLRDLKKGVATGSLSGTTDPTNSVAVGTGQVDWPSLLEASRNAGVKHYFIEDESPFALAQVPQTLKYLRSLGL
jgi:sugar phosphate isomerase/epimerase